MGTQLTVRLTDDLRKALRAASRRMQRRSSEIVRLALQKFLGTLRPAGRPVDRVRGLLGSLESGIPDLARKHRTYIIHSIKSRAKVGDHAYRPSQYPGRRRAWAMANTCTRSLTSRNTTKKGNRRSRYRRVSAR
jgi:hypothetical protein